MNERERRSIRLQGFDYAQEGAYFLTICAYQRVCLFGDVVNGDMQLSELGRIVQEEWLRTPMIRKEVELDEFIVMPNHFHAVVVFVGDGGDANVGGARPCAPTKHNRLASTAAITGCVGGGLQICRDETYQ